MNYLRLFYQRLAQQRKVPVTTVDRNAIVKVANLRRHQSTFVASLPEIRRPLWPYQINTVVDGVERHFLLSQWLHRDGLVGRTYESSTGQLVLLVFANERELEIGFPGYATRQATREEHPCNAVA